MDFTAASEKQEGSPKTVEGTQKSVAVSAEPHIGTNGSYEEREGSFN